MEIEALILNEIDSAGGEIDHADLVERLEQLRRRDAVAALLHLRGAIEPRVIVREGVYRPVLVYRRREAVNSEGA